VPRGRRDAASCRAAVERDTVVATFGHDQIRPPLARLDVLDVHRPHGRVVLIAHRLEAAAAMLEIAADAAHEPDVRIGVDEDLHVHLFAQRGLCEHEDALDDDHGSRHDVALLDATRVAREVVDRYVDGAAGAQLAQMLDEQRVSSDDG